MSQNLENSLHDDIVWVVEVWQSNWNHYWPEAVFVKLEDAMKYIADRSHLTYSVRKFVVAPIE